MKTKGYRNRAERIQDRNDRAARVWKAAYTWALGWSTDPEGEAHRAMTEYNTRNPV